MSFLCPRFIDVKTFRMMKMSEERGNMLHGVLLIALFSCAAFYIGDFPWVKSLSFSPMIVGIMLGMLYANSLRNRLPATWVPGILFCSKRVLRLGIVLYGFRLTFQDVLAVGAYDGARLVGLAGCSADCESMWQIGVDVLPSIPQDTTDRNRTSPVAFTGNKFEFRMPGSSQSIAGPVTVLNTIMAEELSRFYAVLKEAPDFNKALHDLVRKAFIEHGRIIFNGNGYSDEWVQEAEKRGLYNLKSTPDALPYFIHEKNIDLFTSHHIFSKEEIFSRYEILLETYSKTIHIEAKTMEDMVRRDFLPALMTYTDEVAASISAKKAVLATLPCTAQEKLLTTLSGYYEAIYTAEEKLEADLATAEGMTDQPALSLFYHETILPDMDAVRSAVDAAETYIPDSILPYPNYEKLLFSV